MADDAALRIELARTYGGDPLLQHARGQITTRQLDVLVEALPAEPDQHKEK